MGLVVDAGAELAACGAASNNAASTPEDAGSGIGSGGRSVGVAGIKSCAIDHGSGASSISVIAGGLDASSDVTPVAAGGVAAASGTFVEAHPSPALAAALAVLSAAALASDSSATFSACSAAAAAPSASASAAAASATASAAAASATAASAVLCRLPRK